MRAFIFLGLCVGLTLGQGYAPPAAPAPPPPPPAAPAPPPAAPQAIEKLMPANPYDIVGDDIDKGGAVSKGKKIKR
jgi:hypothetical protein